MHASSIVAEEDRGRDGSAPQCPSIQMGTATIAVPVRHLTESDLAQRWRVSERTVQSWRWKGTGPVFLRVCGRVLYRQEDILAYERS